MVGSEDVIMSEAMKIVPPNGGGVVTGVAGAVVMSPPHAGSSSTAVSRMYHMMERWNSLSLKVAVSITRPFDKRGRSDPSLQQQIATGDR